MQQLRSELRQYELSLPRDQRKRLGQFFTEPAVARLLAAISVGETCTRVLDPMAGHGSLLDAAAERLAIVGGAAELSGVEVDEDTAALCERRMRLSAGIYGQSGSSVVRGSAFGEASLDSLHVGNGFDLVIANPPYVRYQAGGGNRSEVRDGLRAAAERFAPDAEREAWRVLVDGYSGLADLSVPSWLLCGILCAPGGILSLVVPRTWMNRDYARAIRYVQLRFFRPMYVVEEHGIGWFGDALVSTTLVVSRRLSSDESAVPLCRRNYDGQSLLRVAVPASAGRAGTSLVERAFPGADPEAAFAAWLAGGCTGGPPLLVQRESLGEACVRVVAGVRSDRRLAALEVATHKSAEVGVSDSRPLVSSEVAQAVPLPARPNLVRLVDLGVCVGQGLRTGCNAFFYVDEVGPSPDGRSVIVRGSPLLGGKRFEVPPGVLRPVLRRQAELSGHTLRRELLRGRVLDLRDWWLPEEQGSCQGQLFRRGDVRLMPEPLARHVRRAAETSTTGNGTVTLIPRLSAVAPNERAAGNGTSRRRWYMLPDFAPRHLPVVFVPRVNTGTPEFVVNSSDPVLVDANFSTITSLGDAPSPAALSALLNSTWVAACCEGRRHPDGRGER